MPKDEASSHNCIKHLRSVVQQQQGKVTDLDKTAAEHKHQLAEQVCVCVCSYTGVCVRVRVCLCMREQVYVCFHACVSVLVHPSVCVMLRQRGLQAQCDVSASRNGTSSC